MQPTGPKRQIIKTRSQRPYIVARVVIVLILLALVVWIALAVTHGLHHAAMAGALFYPPESRSALVR